MKETQICCNCYKTISGRSDKKFCNQYCRTEYNNKKYQKNKQVNAVKRINYILLHNREVLKELIEIKKIKITDMNTLSMLGFHFDFYTHAKYTKGKKRCFCYDFGYMKQSVKSIELFRIYEA